MNRFAFFRVLAFALCLGLLASCATIQGSPDQAGSEDARYDDAGIKTRIGSALLKKDAAKANDVSVHCFNGHVFLIGEADKEFRGEALQLARNVEGVVHVTTHWFPVGTASSESDALIESEIASQLPAIAAFNTSRVSVDVWGGHVVLTGIVDKQNEINRAVAKIKKIEGVKSVTSYLTVD